MALATRAQQSLPDGSLWMLEYPCCHQMMTQTRPKAVGRFSGEIKISNFFKSHRSAYKQQFRGFGHQDCGQ